MPSYDIRCDDCRHEEVRIVRIADLDNLEPCPECESKNVRNIIKSAPSVHYKGPGWFKTSGDYHKKTGRNETSRKMNKVTVKDIEEHDRKVDKRTGA